MHDLVELPTSGVSGEQHAFAGDVRLRLNRVAPGVVTSFTL